MSDPARGAQKRGDPTEASLTPARIDGLVARLPPDTTLSPTRFLKGKLTQLRKARP